jgi:glycosyltransferase involved in cell wall biosynthesis
MRIALVVPGGVDRSGTHRVIPALLALIHGLAQRHEVHVFAVSQESRRGSWPLVGAQVHNIPPRLAFLRTLWAIVRLHRERPFDVVQSIWAGHCGFIAVCASRLLRRACLVHVAGGEFVSLPAIRYGGTLRLLSRLQGRFVLRGATRISAASEPMVAAIRERGFAAERISLGVDLAAWPPRVPVRIAGSTPRLVHVASLNRVKDQTTLLHALALLKKSGVAFQADIVGEDTMQGAIQNLAGHLGLAECVRFTGFMTQTQLHEFLAGAHLNLVSSLHEAGPVVVLEAAVVGVPTVGTRVGHIAEWAPHAAVAVPVADAAGLSSAIAALLADENRRLALALEAQRRAIAEDSRYTVRRFDSLCAQTVKRGN